MPLTSLIDQPPPERRAFFEDPNGFPESFVDRFVFGRDQRLGRIGVSGAAAPTKEIALLDFPEYSVAVGAGDRRGDTWLFGVICLGRNEGSDPAFLSHL